jgi:hypothetical protein
VRVGVTGCRVGTALGLHVVNGDAGDWVSIMVGSSCLLLICFSDFVFVLLEV